MKAAILLHLAAASTAFVLPDQQIFQSFEKEASEASNHFSSDRIKHEVSEIWQKFEDDIEDVFEHATHSAYDFFDDVKSHAADTKDNVVNDVHDAYFDAQGWLDAKLDQGREEFDEITSYFEEEPPQDDEPPHDHPPHHGPPHHGRPPHHGPPHHHPPHHHKPNKTVYELIASSKYTTRLAKLINEHKDLVKLLNGTAANYTVFAPTDRAFEKIPEHAPKPSKEQLKKILTYHVSPEFYPAGRVLVSKTIPTLLDSSELGKDNPQRLSTTIGLRGLRVNFYSRVVAINIFGTNGVIHGVDSILLPPPKTLKIIELLPSEFSTLELGLTKTGLDEGLNATRKHGGTLFAPSNWAFFKLGPRINAFLFSSAGLKYLKALLEYHVVPDQTLYSDAFYGSKDDKSKDGAHHGPPRGFYHYDLPTLLKDRKLSVDIGRYGRLISIKVNGFARVSDNDGVAEDGVIHSTSSVLIPPKEGANGVMEMWDGESEMSQEEFMERLEPYVSHSRFGDL